MYRSLLASIKRKSLTIEDVCLEKLRKFADDISSEVKRQSENEEDEKKESPSISHDIQSIKSDWFNPSKKGTTIERIDDENRNSLSISSGETKLDVLNFKEEFLDSPPLSINSQSSVAKTEDESEEETKLDSDSDIKLEGNNNFSLDLKDELLNVKSDSVTHLQNISLNTHNQHEKKNKFFIEYNKVLTRDILLANTSLQNNHQYKNKDDLFSSNECILSKETYKELIYSCDFKIVQKSNSFEIFYVSNNNCEAIKDIDNISIIAKSIRSLIQDLSQGCLEKCSAISSISVNTSKWNNNTMLTIGGNNAVNLQHDLDRLVDFAERYIGLATIKSIYFYTVDKSMCSLKWGESRIFDRILDTSMYIYPTSTFSINPEAFEHSLSVIYDMLKMNKNTTLVDVCCGKGEYLLPFKKLCGHLLGIDGSIENINNAKQNALNEGATNAKFLQGYPSEFYEICSSLNFNEICCILNGPNLDPKVIVQIRKNEKVKKVVVVLNSDKCYSRIILDLCRSPSKTKKGNPFVPIKSVPIDIHPHTNSFQMVYLFERIYTGDIVNLNTSSINHQNNHISHSKYFNGNQNKFNTPPPNISLKYKTSPSYKNTELISRNKPYHRNYFNHNFLESNPHKQDYFQQQQQELKLSFDQINWLNQMNKMHGSNFQRNKWVRFKLNKQNQYPSSYKWRKYSQQHYPNI